MLLLNNPFLDPDAIIREQQALNKKGVRNGITPLQMLQKKIKDLYFPKVNQQVIANEEALEKLSQADFNEFPRLKYVLEQVFQGNTDIQAPHELSDWKPDISFSELNLKYGYFNNDLSDVFNRLAVACYKMTTLVEHQAFDPEMAYKLMALFYDPNKSQDDNFNLISQKFNKLISTKQDKTIEHPYHDVLVTELNNLPPYNENFPGWLKFINKEGVKSLSIFSQCAENIDFLPFETIKDAHEFMLKQKYPRADENIELAKLCKNMVILNSRFEAALNEVSSGWPKKETDNLPIVDIQDSTGQYFWVKLPTQDMRALFLGNLIPGCCQFIDGDSKICVQNGIRYSDNGFYVLLKAEETNTSNPRIVNHEINDTHFSIVAQSYAWKTNNGNLCLDSMEWNKNLVTLDVIKDLMSKFSKHVFEEHPDIKYITVGTGGQTPDAMYDRCKINESMFQGYMYPDARTQYLVAANISNEMLDELQERLKTFPEALHTLILYAAPYFQDIQELSNALLNINPSHFFERIKHVNLPSRLSADDFKQISYEDYQHLNASEQSTVSTVCKILNSQSEAELRQWLPTIPDHELRYISIMKNDFSLDFQIEVVSRLPDVLRYAALNEIDSFNQFLLMKTAEYPEALAKVLAFYPNHASLIDAITRQDQNNDSVLTKTNNNLESIAMLLDLFPSSKERFEAIKAQNDNDSSILMNAFSNPDVLNMLMSDFSREQRQEILNMQGALKDCILLQKCVDHPKSLKIILEKYTPEELLPHLLHKNEWGDTVLTHADKNTEALKLLISLYPEEALLNILKTPNFKKLTPLRYAISSPESFQILFEHYPIEERLDALCKPQGKHKETILQQAVLRPKTLPIIFQNLQPNQQIDALASLSSDKKTILSLLASNPNRLNMVLELLPDTFSLVIKSRAGELTEHSLDILDSIKSIRDLMNDMQGLAKPESIKAFVHAIIKNEDIDAARESLFKTNASISFFKSNNNEAIQACIEKLHPYWLSRIQPHTQHHLGRST